MNSFYRLHVPSVISPRYMNSAKRNIHEIFSEEKKRQKEEIPSKKSLKASGNFKWNFEITIKSDKKINFFESPSHELELLNQQTN